jgi:hypothetical protein
VLTDGTPKVQLLLAIIVLARTLYLRSPVTHLHVRDQIALGYLVPNIWRPLCSKLEDNPDDVTSMN